MTTLSIALLSSLILIPSSARAMSTRASKALAELQAEAERGITGLSAEDMRANFAEGFTGERTVPSSAPALPAGEPRQLANGQAIKPASSNLTVDRPIAGAPVAADKRAAPRTKAANAGGSGAADPEKLIKWATYGSLGVGAALSIGGIFCPPLLFFGGFLLGVGATLWVISKLMGGE